MTASRYIAIEGPIGVGKSSLARRLADELDGELILEEADANPFLDRFYQDPRGSALPARAAPARAGRTRKLLEQ